MLFRNGRPVPSSSKEESSSMTPEMMKMLIDGVSDKIIQKLKNEGVSGMSEGESDVDYENTLKRLANAMASNTNVEGKSFNNVVEAKKVEADKDKTSKTLDLLKDIK